MDDTDGTGDGAADPGGGAHGDGANGAASKPGRGGDGADRTGGEAGRPPPERDAAAVADELADALEQVAADLRERRHGPFGLPTPPAPRDVLRFTDEYAIPFAVAVLEANVRALELLQGAIRAVEAGDRAGREARATRRRAEELSRTTLDRLDGVLADVERAVTGTDGPPDGPARQVLEEARDLRAELEAALEDADRTRDAAEAAIDVEADPEDARAETDPRGGAVDVDAELASIRDELDEGDDERTVAESDDGDESMGPDGDEPADG